MNSSILFNVGSSFLLCMHLKLKGKLNNFKIPLYDYKYRRTNLIKKFPNSDIWGTNQQSKLLEKGVKVFYICNEDKGV